jgi:hypothetical protein
MNPVFLFDCTYKTKHHKIMSLLSILYFDVDFFPLAS